MGASPSTPSGTRMESINNNSSAEQGQQEQFIYLENIHKTYLLGIEGVAALRFAIHIHFY